MLLNTPENRLAITEYLENVGEDSFIKEFIIPFFSSNGYYLYRINSHGPAEHGKDIIFYRHVPIFYDNEYVVVQAKSEKVIPSNVERCSSQMVRALKISFKPKSGGPNLNPHYAIFVNSKKHTNDAYIEFQELIKEYPHIKILSQENVCELIIKTSIAPKHLLDKLSKNISENQTQEDEMVLSAILSNIPSEMDDMLDHKMKFIKDKLSAQTKELVITYILDRWHKDMSWDGTYKPMKWLDTYFEFISENQLEQLFDVFNELSSSTPSFKALPYTKSVVEQIHPAQIKHIEKDFVDFVARRVISYPKDNIDVFFDKIRQYSESDIEIDKASNETINKILLYQDAKRRRDKEECKRLDTELYYIAHPDRNNRTKG
jgi:hypothetical protein